MINYDNIIENDFEKEIYEEKKKEILKYLRIKKEMDFWDIVNTIGGSERRMIRLLDEMIRNNYINFNNGYFKILGDYNFSNLNCNCKKCKGTGVDINDLLEIKRDFTEIYNNKPKPTLLFDQRPVTINTSLRRVGLLEKNYDINENTKILFLGDDDITSIALALTKKCEIYVCDIDKRLLDYIEFVSKERNLNIKCFEFNVMNKVENQYKNFFDILVTDPTPEKNPFILFMNSAIKFTKKNGIIYTSIYSTAMKKTLELQKVITEMNLYISEMIKGFTLYKSLEELYTINDKKLFEKYNVKFDDETICFTETMFRCEKTPDTNIIENNIELKDILGKATKRVIKDKNKEVANSTEYLEKIREDIIKEI